MRIDKSVLLVTGMPGAGKSVFIEAACSLSIPVYVMGDVVREEAEKRGLAPEDKVLGKIALELRRTFGDEIIAKRISEKIARDRSRLIMIDGVRSLNEVEYFRKIFSNVIIVAVHASPQTRFHRLLKRRREDDPQSWEEFVERDRRELKIGIGNVIALADVMLVNENISREAFYKLVFKKLKELIESEDKG